MLDFIAALQIPDASTVNLRVAKTLLVEHAAPTAADKRLINEGIEECTWLAALKPNALGVPDYRDEAREVLEIVVLRVTLRPAAKAARLAELIHRAIPYPVVLVLNTHDGSTLSLAAKRWSQNEAGKTVLDGDPIELHLSHAAPLHEDKVVALTDALALSSQPRVHLLALYQALMDVVLATHLQAITGRWQIAATAEQRERQRIQLTEHAELERAVAGVQREMGRATQMQKRVELNLTLQSLKSKMLQIAND